MLLPTGGHSGVQTTDLDSTSNNVVEATVYVNIHGYRNEREKFDVEVKTYRKVNMFIIRS